MMQNPSLATKGPQTKCVPAFIMMVADEFYPFARLADFIIAKVANLLPT